MDAVDALNEIAFWLERELRPTFKVQAFRKAAGVVGALDAGRAGGARPRRPAQTDEGDRRHAPSRSSGRRSTARCPNTLKAAGAAAREPLAEGGGELRGSLRGDLHSHSDWSDGGSP